MNKTVTINISGLIFNIDEMAFAKLKNYLGSIERYFTTSDGGEEIMTDIEGRIAEMFSERISSRKEVVSMADVEHMISVMGQPEDFIDEETLEENERKKNFNKEEPKNHEFDEELDDEFNRGPKRFFRDPDKKVIGGVCAGIGHYFGIDPIIVRLLFVLAFLFGFSGILLYVIFWIITPKAMTRAEKLQMRGKKVNIDNIKNTVRKEADDVKKNFKNFEGKLGDYSSSESGQRIGNFISDVGYFILNILRNILNIAGKLIGFALIFIGGIVLFSLGLSIIGISTFDGVFMINGDLFEFTVGEAAQLLVAESWIRPVASIGFGLMIGLPIIFLILIGVKVIFGIADFGKRSGFSLFGLWVIGAFMFLVSTTYVASDFSKSEKTVQSISLPYSFADTVHVSVDTEMLSHGSESSYPGDFFNLLKMDETSVSLANVKFNVVESKNDSISIIVTQKARGGSFKEAKVRAENIEFSYNLYGTEIVLSPFYKFLKEDKYRVQELFVTLALPEGKTVHLSEGTSWVIYDIKNRTNTHDSRMNDHYWRMTEDGLECTDCSFKGNSSKLKSRTDNLNSLSKKELERKLVRLGREIEMKSHELENKTRSITNKLERRMAKIELKIKNADDVIKIREYNDKLQDLQSDLQVELRELNYQIEDEILEITNTIEEIEKLIEDKQTKKTSQVRKRTTKNDLTLDEPDNSIINTRLLFPNPFRILI
ncbi:MAG: PspC domain-containing protein [Salibacteraceae bacterium]